MEACLFFFDKLRFFPEDTALKTAFPLRGKSVYLIGKNGHDLTINEEGVLCQTSYAAKGS